MCSAQYELKPLPFALNALEPFISETTITTHYNKHHGGYVKKLNAAAGSDPALKGKSIVDIIENTDAFSTKVVNLASQIWNHEFYWQCVNPMESGQGISDAFSEVLSRDFEGFDNFKRSFTDRAKKHFGSGWMWLVIADGKMSIVDGHGAANPLSDGQVPLLVVDIWYVCTSLPLLKC